MAQVPKSQVQNSQVANRQIANRQMANRQMANMHAAKGQVANRQIAKWFDRKFDFSFPVELYPDLCVRLRGTPARLEELVRECPAERMLRAMPPAIVPETAPATVPPEAKWSAQEHAGHLLNLEPLWLARVEDYVAGRDELSVTDLSNRATFEARYNEHALPELLAAFRQARLALVDRLEKLETEFFGRTLPHPRLKTPMRLVDHLFFVAEHDDHHLAIIWEMIRQV